MTATAARQSPRRRSASKTKWTTVVLFCSPFIVGVVLFLGYPVGAALYYSLTDYQAGSLLAPKFVGFANYVQALVHADDFWVGVHNTLWMVLIMVPLRTVWAVFVAWAINRVKSGARVYRTIMYLPSMVPVVGVALAFIVVLNPAGPLDSVLSWVGINGPSWLGDPAWTKPSLVLMALWVAGDVIVIVGAAMLDVPADLYEAAELDGAGGWRRFWHVTLPGISPVIYFSLITGMIYTFQYFTEAFVVSGATSNGAASSNEVLGYPHQSLLFYSTEIYQQGFSYFKTGYASALAWMLFAVILVVTVVFIRVSRRWVSYGGGGR
jgi:multiple sugar transport system permease protein